MRIQHHHLEVLLLVLFLTINIGAQTLTKPSHEIVLQPPNLSSGYKNVRPPIEGPKVTAPKQQQTQEVITSPCNGTFQKTNGTTCGLKDIMIGRCYEYQYIKRGLFLSNQTAVKNCTELYFAFESAVRYKPYCNMDMTTYERFFRLALDGVHVINRAMFWSGTYKVAHAYAGHGFNYITLEDTLAAALVDNLMWCGKENDTDGYDLVSCPNNCQNNRWADVAFWGLASKTFAQLVAGEIYVVLNGSRGVGDPAFRNNSYFAEFELPNFRQSGQYRVSQVNVLLLHSPDRVVTERCGEKSLLVLEQLVTQASFTYACKDDPEELILIMCGDQWNARECQIARQVLRQAWDTKVFGRSSTSERQSSTFLFLLTLMMIVVSVH